MSTDQQSESPKPSSRLGNSTPTEVLVMEPIGVELTTVQALRMIAKVMEMTKLGVSAPDNVRFEMGNLEMRIKHNTDVILRATLRPNGKDNWYIEAEHQIRRVVQPEFHRFHY